MFYLALEDEGYACLQVESYADGTVIAYDAEYEEDSYGGPTCAQLDLEEFAPYEIGKAESGPGPTPPPLRAVWGSDLGVARWRAGRGW
ncbi:hypothetical protein HS041_27465 [Planomonospora sp. ID67723]|uniref:hypothetical protein n=1 Tax=Planomonospora sp. ID67723 TaxID=2738134 RepID=UPI0018C388AA|nr:hypothetical protein [Planomonospora sp. ID67723]MBG0831483.1 hypothetical protein [Planomonospora sp. ID67723]